MIIQQVLLFFVSFFIVFLSTYFIVSVLNKNNLANNALIFALTMVAQVIITFEILSIFKIIYPQAVLLANLIFLLISYFIWKQNGCPKFNYSYDAFLFQLKRIKKAVLKDRFLLELSVFFIISAIAGLFLAICTPMNNWDGMTYHVTRIYLWLQNHSMSHFETSCARHTMFPVNSEILIMWPMAFTRLDMWSQIIQYLAYIGNIYILFNFLNYLKISMRRILWAIFILCSFPAVILQASSGLSDLIVSFFIFASIYLFFYGIRENNYKSLIFSAFSFAVALGTKSTSYIAFPIVLIIFPIAAIIKYKKESYKHLGIYALSLLLCFIIFSSYNYILNYLDFKNIFGLNSYVQLHSHQDPLTFKAVLANFVRYIVAFFDLSGFDNVNDLCKLLLDFKFQLFHLFGINESSGLRMYSSNDTQFINTDLYENFAFSGPLGFILFLPAMFWGIIKIFKTNNKQIYIYLAGLGALIFIIFQSIMIGFTSVSIRYLITAAIIGSPILAFSYMRKPGTLKAFITLIAIFCYFKATMFNYIKPIMPTFGISVFNCSKTDLRYIPQLGHFNQFPLLDYLKNEVPDNSKIALIFSDDEWFSHFFVENPTWKIYPLRYRNLINNKNYNDYDYIIFSGKSQAIYPLESYPPFYRTDPFNFTDMPKNFKQIKSLISNGNAPVRKMSWNRYEYYVYKKLDKQFGNIRQLQ